jgi:hypothetical protein
MAKKLLFNRASVKEGDNRVVCESRFQPHYIKPGCYIKFEESAEHYMVSKSEDSMYIFDFEYYSNGVVLIMEDEAMNLVIGDEIDITHKEYEINPKITIQNGGIGYFVGDIIEIDEGSAFVDPSTGEIRTAKLRVASTDEQGAVKTFEVEHHGLYTEAPDQNMLIYWQPTGGSGENLELNIIYNTINNRSVLRREVANLEKVNPKGYILYLDNELPEHVRTGKLSVKKKNLYLSSNYASGTRFSDRFQLIIDFTGEYGLPMLVENSLSLAFVYNKGINMVDSHIRRLEKRIEELEKKSN